MKWFPWKIVLRKRWVAVHRLADERGNIECIFYFFVNTVGFGGTILELDPLSGRWIIRWRFKGYAREIAFSVRQIAYCRDPMDLGIMWGGKVRDEYRRACGELEQQNKPGG